MKKYTKNLFGRKRNYLFIASRSFKYKLYSVRINKSSISRELKRCSNDFLGYIPDRGAEFANHQ